VGTLNFFETRKKERKKGETSPRVGTRSSSAEMQRAAAAVTKAHSATDKAASKKVFASSKN